MLDRAGLEGRLRPRASILIDFHETFVRWLARNAGTLGRGLTHFCVLWALFVVQDHVFR